MAFVFDPTPTPQIAVEGSDLNFPVHRIYCVGQNYSDHVKEMGGDPKSSPPVFFSKHADAIVTDNAAVPYASATDNLHYEVELVIALGGGGRNIEPLQAASRIYGYAVGIDFTRRDLQAAAKAKGKPWDTAKGFDVSAPISKIQPSENGELEDGRIWLAVNGETKQDARLSDMIWSVTEIIVELSRYYELKAGDLIFTGTPAGVSAIGVGDRIAAAVENVGEIEFEITVGPTN